MKAIKFAALLFGCALLIAGPAHAGDLTITMANGRVTLEAHDVTVRQILAEWARVGQTRIVNGDKVPGGPVTLQLTNVPERQALDTILRSVPGYIAAPRLAQVASASVYDRILILATTARVASGPVAPVPMNPAGVVGPGGPPGMQRPPGMGVAPAQPTDDDDEPTGDTPPPVVPPPNPQQPGVAPQPATTTPGYPAVPTTPGNPQSPYGVRPTPPATVPVGGVTPTGPSVTPGLPPGTVMPGQAGTTAQPIKPKGPGGEDGGNP